MKAIVTTAYGSEDVLQLQEVATPVPEPEQIRVKVAAFSVNPVDWKIRSGQARILSGLKTPPKILGGDFSGVVDAVGGQVTAFKVGDEVWGMISAMKGGAYAEYVCVAEHNITPKPESLSFQEAASMPLVALTAYQALINQGAMLGGERAIYHHRTDN